MEEKMQGIRASDLVVGYEGKSVLKDVNFWVRPGQILTLIGPNGSGKSTLLKSITRQLKTIAGQVYLAEGTMDAYTDAALAKQMATIIHGFIAFSPPFGSVTPLLYALFARASIFFFDFSVQKNFPVEAHKKRGRISANYQLIFSRFYV